MSAGTHEWDGGKILWNAGWGFRNVRERSGDNVMKLFFFIAGEQKN
jgi:hypothetical protein